MSKKVKYSPLGTKLLILQLPRENHKTEAGIEVVQADLDEGEIVEVGSDVQDVYKKGDIILYSKEAGQGEFYNGKTHLWIDGRAIDKGGDVVAIVSEENE